MDIGSGSWPLKETGWFMSKSALKPTKPPSIMPRPSAPLGGFATPFTITGPERPVALSHVNTTSMSLFAPQSKRMWPPVEPPGI
ncbi:MAG: hypothetical protein COZ96_10595 [Nitrospirae bacterium CG_4_8_14_3_um_filter_70_85]|nr:MAG: hypothetical protein COZ96_10595 [Nitrospirae bacterium CG_4_8_14_3_um_filter_70_85]